jgi:hypothetical protein
VQDPPLTQLAEGLITTCAYAGSIADWSIAHHMRTGLVTGELKVADPGQGQPGRGPATGLRADRSTSPQPVPS